VFDVLVGGELLRSSLQECLEARSLSTEATVELEYTFLALPPQLDTSIPQHEWCAAARACRPAQIRIACWLQQLRKAACVQLAV
jgi:hypothetical protein